MAESFAEFLRENKKSSSEVEYAPTKDFTDKKGEPIKWKFRTIGAREFNKLREKCTKNVPVPGKRGQYVPQVNIDQLNNETIAACTVYPNLENAELQDSYGVKTPGDLLYALVSNPGEYNDLLMFINGLCGFDTTIEEKVDEVKNS